MPTGARSNSGFQKFFRQDREDRLVVVDFDVDGVHRRGGHFARRYPGGSGKTLGIDVLGWKEDVADRFEKIEEALSTFDDRPVVYDPAEIARAGVFSGFLDGAALDRRRSRRHADDDQRARAD